MCIYGGKLARDRDVSPVGGENYNLHIHICKYDMHNFPVQIPLPLSKG